MSLSLLRSSAVVGFFTFNSRVLGLIRDVLIAKFFGATMYTDAFFIAFKIPNFFRRLFSEGAFSQAFVPVLGEYIEQKKDELKDFINRVAGTLFWIILIMSAFVIVFAPYVVLIFSPGFSNNIEQLTATIEMLRITFPYLLLISLTGFMSSILNSMNRFAVASATPIILNLSLILGILVAEDFFAERAIFSLAWAVLWAGILQLIVQIIALRSLDIHIVPKWGWHHKGVRKIMTLVVPAIFGVSVVQISILLNSMMASFLPTGSISWIYYSDRLCELPLGVVGITIATVILPKLSRLKHAKEKNSHLMDSTLDSGLKLVLLISLPATIGLIMMAKPILITLFQYNQFSVFDVSQTRWSLMAYALGLVSFMWIKVLASAFFSCQDTKTPVRIGVISLLVGIFISVVSTIILHYQFSIGHAGLALGTAIGSWLNAFFLFRALYRKHDFNILAWRDFIWKIIVASVGLICFLIFAGNYWMDWEIWNIWERASNLCIIIFSGMTIYALLLYLLRLKIKII